VTVHRSACLPDEDRELRRGVFVTRPARTIIDLAGRLPEPLLASIIDEGVVQRRWTFDDLAACAQRQPPGRRGSAVLRRILEVRVDEPVLQSWLEQRVVRLLAPLRPFEVQHQLVLRDQILVLDVAWPWWKVAAEIDGRSYRALSRTAHDRESRKLNLLSSADWRVIHLTATMPARECIAALLAVMPPDAFPRLRIASGF
jgi:hypothetical protein